MARHLAEQMKKYDITGAELDPEADRIVIILHLVSKSLPRWVVRMHSGRVSIPIVRMVVSCDLEHAYTKDGGLAVLFGNIAQNGCVVKTAGVDPVLWHFEGPAVCFDSQEDACEGILGWQGELW